MTSPLEKAARALYDHETADCLDGDEYLPFEEAKAEWVACVRAVLLAVREPDEALSDAGWEGMAGDHTSWSWSIDERPQDDAFKAMIDAILAPKETT